MLFDYSAMTQINVKSKVTEYQVIIHGDWYADAKCERCEFPINVFRENGYVRMIRVKLRPQETLLIELTE